MTNLDQNKNIFVKKIHANLIFVVNRIYDGTEPGLIVGDPVLIRKIMCGSTALDVFINRRAVKTTHPIMSKFLSSLEDNEWKRVRAITTPTFTSGKLKTIFPIMQNASFEMTQTLGELADSKQEVDLKLLYGTYTMNVIAYSAFATQPDATFSHQASLLFTFPFWRKFLDYVVPMSILEFFRFTVLPPDPMDFFKKITIAAIRHRRAGNTKYPDFLQLLMNAEDDTITDSDETKKPRSKVLSEDEILSQSVLFFSVGFETSSQLLTYCSYCLALNPDCQERAYKEIVELVRENHNKIDNELLQKLDYVNAVIDESLRIYNPVLRMERRASSDFVLGDTGITVPKGMIVGIPVWAIHHSDEYYPNPDRFDPERFLPQNRHKIVPSTYLPFGDGPRVCIGMRFALLETKLALVEILLKFRFVKSPGTKIPLEFHPTGRPLLGPKAILIGVERRGVVHD